MDKKKTAAAAAEAVAEEGDIICVFNKVLNTIIALTHSAAKLEAPKTDDISFLSRSQTIDDGQLIMNHLYWCRLVEWSLQLPELSKHLIFTILCQLTYANFTLSSLRISLMWFSLPLKFIFLELQKLSRFLWVKQSGESKSLTKLIHIYPRGEERNKDQLR